MRNLDKHPIFQFASDIKAICQPLLKLNIDCFAHMKIDEAGKLSTISNHPEFHKNYLEKSYHHSGIHLAEFAERSNYILWDVLQSTGNSAKMVEDLELFNIRHSFTIIEKNSSGADYYHFSTAIKDSFNHVYLSNLDLLKLFIGHFKASVRQSKNLSRAYNIKFDIKENTAEYSLGVDNELKIRREKFLHELLDSQSKTIQCKNFNNFIIHKDSHQAVAISRQQTKCLLLLFEGHSAKEIAKKMELSPRTINNYLEAIKDKLGCRNSKELISIYYTQLMHYI